MAELLYMFKVRKEMKMGEFTIVTDFFDIGRGQDANKELSRTKERYFEEFSYWAKIRNKLIVYTDPESGKRVKEIRAKYGLLDKTVVVEMKNEELFEKEGGLLKRMIETSTKESFLNFRYVMNAFSNNPRYDYLWMMKTWFMNDALERGLLSDSVAWVDFGFDHGGRNFIDSNDFDFTWSYDFSEKIQLFCLSDPNKLSGMDSLQMQDDCVMANIFCVPKSLVPTLWQLVRNAMEALLMLDCVDDDQQLLLMAYKARPELFEIHISNWSLPMKEYGGSHLKTKELPKVEVKEPSALQKFKAKIKPYCLWVKDPKREFAKRSYERAGKFYK